MTLDHIDWQAVGDQLDGAGYAVIAGLLDARACGGYVEGYDDAARYRSRVVMERHGFGRGEYQYFGYPLPEALTQMRAALYGPLARVTNRWHNAMGIEARFPQQHADFIERCHGAGQVKPTPLILRYREGDYNCLHQDLCGEHVFPLQVAMLLSRPGDDFTGGEFVLTEQRPRMQSRVEVVPLEQGDAVIFPVNYRPVNGTRGVYRVTMRHGVSRLSSGARHTLGIIFHDAEYLLLIRGQTSILQCFLIGVRPQFCNEFLQLPQGVRRHSGRLPGRWCVRSRPRNPPISPTNLLVPKAALPFVACRTCSRRVSGIASWNSAR